MKAKILKTLFVLACGFLATNSFARGETCAAYDHGFEEHSGGHGSCESCLDQHGGCNYICFSESYECTATGKDRDGREVTGRGYDSFSERSARQEAEDRCYDRGGRDCYATCSTDRRETSNSDCGRRIDDRRDTCSASDYLNQRPDVRAAGFSACTHYTRHGRGEGMCNPC